MARHRPGRARVSGRRPEVDVGSRERRGLKMFLCGDDARPRLRQLRELTIQTGAPRPGNSRRRSPTCHVSYG